MRLLWADGPSSFEGRYFSFHDADIGPRPADPHGPPIMVGADTAETIARIPGIGGDHWISSPRNSLSFLREVLPTYRRALEEAGRPFRGLPIMRTAYVGDDEREAQAVLERSFQRMFQIQSRWGQPGERSNLSFDQLKQEKLLLGSPEQVAAGLIALNRELGGRVRVPARLHPRHGSAGRTRHGEPTGGRNAPARAPRGGDGLPVLLATTLPRGGPRTCSTAVPRSRRCPSPRPPPRRRPRSAARW